MSGFAQGHVVAPRPIFPFAALVGQGTLREALLLAAIDPALGGVLITGPRGTAKSTSARALAELLPEGRMVTLPLGASEERLIGTLDVQAALGEGRMAFAPGLLAEAHRGVLYVDEVNLLPDSLVDALLDAAASGVNTVEREGISHSHEASFVLIGTMNPEEGELRPQLLDRFGLMVELENCFEPRLRLQIVQARLAFEADPVGYRSRFAAAQSELRERVKTARLALSSLLFSDAVHAKVSDICINAGVDGLRADLVMLRAARALAALEGRPAIELEHVDRVAEVALRHRRKDRDPSETAPASQATREGQERRGTRSEENGHSTSEGDWGYLPPQPVGMAQVKKLRPLLPKS